MKRIAVISLLFGSAFLLSSCHKENTEEYGAPMTILAESAGIGTKADMAYKYDILWNESDQIYVKGGIGRDRFNLVEGAGTTKGVFRQNGSMAISGAIDAFYPAKVVGGQDLVWPSTQTVNEPVPMMCHQDRIEGNNVKMAFSSLGSVLQIFFTTVSENVALREINVQSGGARLSGKFTVDQDGKAVIDPQEGDPGITLSLGDYGFPVGLKAECFNIMIPAGDYKYLTIRFITTDGRVCQMISRSFPSLKRNVVARISLSGKFQDVEYVDLGLGVRWATMNVGASRPGGFGDLFAWGETAPKELYDFSTYKFFKEMTIGSDPHMLSTKYVTDRYFGDVDQKTELDHVDDAAYANWGPQWRMPTYNEFDDLKNRCTWTKTTVDGMQGYKISGNGNSIFLPSGAMYWSSSLNWSDNDQAYAFGSSGSDDMKHSSCSRQRGLLVRPVRR